MGLWLSGEKAEEQKEEDRCDEDVRSSKKPRQDFPGKNVGRYPDRRDAGKTFPDKPSDLNALLSRKDTSPLFVDGYTALHFDLGLIVFQLLAVFFPARNLSTTRMFQVRYMTLASVLFKLPRECCEEDSIGVLDMSNIRTGR
jgi:hypothetical protein